ncbi:MAG: GTPase domain-containing protein [Pirellulaceae bacterium]|nr:GTPase domain-containing protein [Pirellulaceae bacterium]
MKLWRALISRLDQMPTRLPIRLPLRLVVLITLWVLPLIVYVGVGLIAIYQAGWFSFIAWSLPVLWLTAWLISRYWPPPKLQNSRLVEPLTPLEFWTPQDAAALQIVDQFRASLPDIDRLSIADPNRYVSDAQALSQLLSQHYHPQSSNHAYRPLTIVELLSVIHLSVEDLEVWMLESVPGSDLVTIGQMEQVPSWLRAVDIGQSVLFVASSITNPWKLLGYPLWRKAGRVTVELQNEVIRAFYQHYLRQVSFYLIEMYSGRLRGGSKQYRERFGRLSSAVHQSGGDARLLQQCEVADTVIAVMGQVKAGKSSLVNALIKDNVAVTSMLPETREVKRYEFPLLESDSVPALASPERAHKLTLLDTPGYSEVDISRRQQSEIKSAVELADIVLLVLSATSPAKESDVQMLHELQAHYRGRVHLKPPPIIAVITHIDQLRPVREWTPPYDWRQPESAKEQSIAAAVAYARELFGEAVVGYACVYTGDGHAPDTSVADEVVPQLLAHLNQGHSAAVLKAFYRQMSQRRYQQLAAQLAGMVKSLLSASPASR